NIVVSPLYPFDLALAEEAVGLEHQRHDHQEIRREVLGAAADIGIDISGGQALHDADRQAADHGAGDRIEAAKDHDRKHLEADQRELDIDAKHVAPDDSAH